MNTQFKCLNPAHSTKKVYARGLCQACYNHASRLVKTGKVTWEFLEEHKRALPRWSHGHGGGHNHEIADWLLKGGKEKL